MATKPETIETDAAETPVEAEKFRRQYSTIVTDEEVVATLDDLSLIKKHRTPADLVRAALTEYAAANQSKVQSFRDYMATVE